MPTYIEGTNIPTSAISGNIKGDAAYWAQRLKGSGTNINDVLFEMAYSTPFEGSTQTGSNYQGQGQGNPNVGALQSGQWKFNTGPTWAAEAVKEPSGMSDIYKQRDTAGNLTGADWRGADYGTPGNRGYTGTGTTGTGTTGTGTTGTGTTGTDTTSTTSSTGTEVFDMAKLTDSMDLSNKLTEVINTNSPLFKAAQTKAMQNMQRRGIVNSTLAQEAVMNSVINVALPIAQAEVNQLVTNLYYNTDWTNKQKMQANEFAYNKMLTELQGRINYTLQQLVGSQNIGLQTLKGTQAMSLQDLQGTQAIDLQTLRGTQATDLQTLIGDQETKLQQDKIKADLWAKYGDWITMMATTEGADQEAWQNMLDMLKGAGGWPLPT